MTKTENVNQAKGSAWSEASGSELVEFALILPALLMLMSGIFWGARAFNVYETIHRAAREGARVAVAPTCFGCGSAGAFLTASGGCSGTDAIDTAITSSMAASGLPCRTGVTVSVSQHQKLDDDTTGSATQWTVVTITYPYQFTLPFTPMNMTTVNISATAQMVEEP